MVILSPVENSADPASLQFAVLGANGQPNTAGWDDDFEDGANYTVEYSQPTQFFNLSGNQLFGGTYNNKDFSLLNQDPQRFLEWLLGLGPLDQQEGSWSAYYNFHQYLFVEEDDPSQGVGIFGRYGIADDETSLVADFYSIGIGGKGIVENRDQDRFGVGYYRTNISDELPNIISSLVGDEDGIEMFYNIEVNPWCHVTVDLQYINPANQQVSDTYVAGIRMKIDI